MLHNYNMIKLMCAECDKEESTAIILRSALKGKFLTLGEAKQLAEENGIIFPYFDKDSKW